MMCLVVCLAWDMQRADARTDWSLDRPSRLQGRALHAAEALLRGNEFFLVPLALLVGVVAGAIVTLMSEIAQIAHVLIYGIPIDVRLSANEIVNPWAAMIAPAARRPAAGPDGVVAPALEDLQRGRPD